ncbi:MAG: cystathionine gamma-lyase, partial [Pseudonocardiales bacterium]|nr:cystathionine gamma-lyase [Pseudonocardiales bacterium]
MIGDGTRCVHGGHGDDVLGAPVHPGPVLSSTFHLGLPADPTPADFYGRADNPTWRALESAIGALDGGECVVFSSGMAAIAAVLRLAAPRGALVLPSDGYYLARSLAQGELAPLGVEVRLAPTAGVWPGGVLDGAGLVLLETPSNPGLDCADIAAAAEAAHAAGALVAVDNTTATPLGQTPLDLGADLVVASGTKALTGHSDLLLGYVAARDTGLVARLTTWRNATGAIPGDFDAWLAHRSLATLDLRLARQTSNAAAVASALVDHPVVRSVRWPGLPGDPSFVVASRQMRRIPGVVTFELASAEAVLDFFTR